MRDTRNVQNVQKWKPRQRKFIDWLALPKSQREPPTQGELADELGICEHTLSRWKKLPGFEDEVVAIVRRHLRDRLPGVYNALGDEAEKGSFQHIKLVLEVTGELDPSLNIRHHIIDDDGDPGPFGRAVALAAKASAGDGGG